MSDANVDMLASGLFTTLTTTNGFYPQDSETQDTSEESVALAADGDLACHNEFNKGHEYRNTYAYCGTALSTDLGSIVTAYGMVWGDGTSAIVHSELSIDFPGPGQQARVTVGGHAHTTNNHSATTNPPRAFDVSGVVPAAAGLGVPSIFGSTVIGSDSSPASGSLNFSMNHVDVPNADGAHFTGENASAVCEATMDFEGACGETIGLAAAWKMNQRTLSDGNESLDRSSLSARQYFDAT